MLLTSSTLLSHVANLGSGLLLRISAERGGKFMQGLWLEAGLIGEVATVAVCACILFAAAS